MRNFFCVQSCETALKYSYFNVVHDNEHMFQVLHNGRYWLTQPSGGCISSDAFDRYESKTPMSRRICCFGVINDMVMLSFPACGDQNKANCAHRLLQMDVSPGIRFGGFLKKSKFMNTGLCMVWPNKASSPPQRATKTRITKWAPSTRQLVLRSSYRFCFCLWMFRWMMQFMKGS